EITELESRWRYSKIHGLRRACSNHDSLSTTDRSICSGRLSTLLRSLLKEVQQILIEAIFMRVGQTMWCARVDNELCPFDLRRRGFAGNVYRYDLIVVAVDHHGRHVK